MGWGNGFITKIAGGRCDGARAQAAALTEATKQVTWRAKDQDLVGVELVDFDGLIAKEKLEDQGLRQQKRRLRSRVITLRT
ncbi:hypothetical protein FN846DRAFT_928442 [Sphaerosporella brunnea]|uniref:Uncharacterized protein n=1 Tax=Sphaerosporella brunnea TaxID=1250544 RepID=A0A5J5F9T8_9PEZI|nr:hypothetical protein FN846DRAFT_928442 [Sphaerosporella brunnea]